MDASLRPCPQPGCRELTRGGRCEQHKKSYEAYNRNTQTPERTADVRWYNSRRWRKLKATVLNRDVVCQENGCMAPATEVDHVIPRKQDESLAYDSSNLQGLCRSCHAKKTRAESGQ